MIAWKTGRADGLLSGIGLNLSDYLFILDVDDVDEAPFDTGGSPCGATQQPAVLDLIGKQVALRLRYTDDIIGGSWLVERRVICVGLDRIAVHVHPRAQLSAVEIS